MTKSTYLNADKKHAAREFLIAQMVFGNVVGLAGPDVNEYIGFMKSKGAQEFEIYENNKDVIIKQLKTSRHKMLLRCMDILEAVPNKKNTLYDLDFCTTIKHLKEHVKKFTDNFIMTFSLRGAGESFTLSNFFSWRGESVINRKFLEVPCKHSLITTEKGKYIYLTYRDTSPMCCIAKIN